MPTCIEWGEERHEECSQFEDRGYDQCAQTEDQGYNECCDWWPCSWACDALVWVSNIVCVAWTWVSNVVCVAWTWVTTAVCVAWDVLTTVVGAVLVTIESIVGWVLSAVPFVIELIEAIPYVGPVIRGIINAVTTFIVVAGSLVDAGLGFIGIRPEKKLRVCTVVLRDESGNSVATPEVARSLLQLACDIYKRDCNVRIIPLGPFKYTTGFTGAETVTDDWIIFDESNSDTTLLDVPCVSSADPVFGLPSSGFQLKTSTLCYYGAWRRFFGYGAPVTCFIIRNVTDAAGCQITLTDYATVDGSTVLPHPSPRTLGHEVGHACMLWHNCVDEDNANMMATQGDCEPDSNTLPDRVNPTINNTQALIIRASKHVTYF